MSALVFNQFKYESANQTVSWTSDTMKAALVMTNTTADTEEDTTDVASFTTLDECDGASYARQTLGTKTVTNDTTNDRTVLDAADVTFSSLGAGTRATQGLLVIQDTGSDATSIPVCYMPFTSNQTHNGSDFPVQFPSTGILLLT